jgi:transcriptional regulator with XRE-family HTH domain
MEKPKKTSTKTKAPSRSRAKVKTTQPLEANAVTAGAESSKPAKDNKSVEGLYAQLTQLIKKKKLSKRDIAARLGMSYQGFLNSFNKRNLRLEAWHDISEFISVPFVAKFETGRQVSQEAQESSAPVSEVVSARPNEMEEVLKLRISNADEKVSILEKQIAALENQLNDKQTIIGLLSEKIK